MDASAAWSANGSPLGRRNGPHGTSATNDFFLNDNQALGPADFDRYTITSPTHAGLDTSGQPLTFLKRNALSAIGATSNYRTFANDFGRMPEVDEPATVPGINLPASR